MPVLASSFRPPAWLRNGHLQTVWHVVRPRRWTLSAEPERLELPDGDFLDLTWLRRARGDARAARLAVLTHGLESDANAGYIRGMVAALHAAGWDALAWNFRGCGTEPNRLPRFYHSGETGDLGTVVHHAAERGGYGHIALVGFSLGGNVTLKYLGEAPPHPAVRAGVGISVPVDLASSARVLDQRRVNKLYLRRFIQSLVGKVEAKAKTFPDGFDLRGIRRIRTFQDFDDRYTSRLHGFRDAADYWARASARQFLTSIRVPTLLLNAHDDPFLSPRCFPTAEAEENPSLYLEATTRGGHVGFVDFLSPDRATYAERRTVEFLTSQSETATAATVTTTAIPGGSVARGRQRSEK